MKKIITIISLILAIIGCRYSNEHENNVSAIPETSKDEIKPGKTRLEQVSELPYRNLNVDETLKTNLIEKATELKTQLDSSNQIIVFYQSGNKVTKIDEKKWDNARKAINYSYELWRDNAIMMTIVGYPSVSKNVQTREETDIYVFEIEHASLTGKCLIFIKNINNKETFEFSYFERN